MLRSTFNKPAYGWRSLRLILEYQFHRPHAGFQSTYLYIIHAYLPFFPLCLIKYSKSKSINLKASFLLDDLPTFFLPPIHNWNFLSNPETCVYKSYYYLSIPLPIITLSFTPPNTSKKKEKGMDLRDIGSSLPPGFRFYPSDEELVCHYLYKKIANEDVLKGTLVEIDLHKCEPWQLPGMWSLFPSSSSISMAAILFSFWEVSCFGCAIVVFEISFCFKSYFSRIIFYFFLKRNTRRLLGKKIERSFEPI